MTRFTSDKARLMRIFVDTNVMVYGLSYWDSLIVAAAQLADCRYLLTEDLQDGLEADGLTVTDPFVHTPDALI